MEASIALLISQWRESPNLKAVIQIWLDVLNEEIAIPVAQLQALQRIDDSEGVWLEYIGIRLGIVRPSISRSSALNIGAFGFDGAGVGFDQSHYSDVFTLEEQTPLGDQVYRNLIKARAVFDLSLGTLEDYRRALLQIENDALIVDNKDMTATQTIHNLGEVTLARLSGALPLPAGVSIENVIHPA